MAASFAPQLIQSYGEKLQSLALHQGYTNQFNNIHLVNFSKLRKLMVVKLSLNAMNGILKTAKNLEAVCFAPKIATTTHRMNDEEIKNMIEKLISDQSSLEYISVVITLDDL